MADQKVFDVSAPQSPEKPEPPKKIMTEPPTGKVEPPKEDTPSESTDVTVTHKGLNIAPVNDADEKTPEITATSPETAEDEEPKEEPTPEPESKEKTDEPAEETKQDEPETPIKEVYGAGSSIPDDSQRASSAVKETMQDPKIFDAKTYYVPIGNTQHKHGGKLGMVIAGLLAAAAAVAGFLYFSGSL